MAVAEMDNVTSVLMGRVELERTLREGPKTAIGTPEFEKWAAARRAVDEAALQRKVQRLERRREKLSERRVRRLARRRERLVRRVSALDLKLSPAHSITAEPACAVGG